MGGKEGKSAKRNTRIKGGWGGVRKVEQNISMPHVVYEEGYTFTNIDLRYIHIHKMYTYVHLHKHRHRSMHIHIYTRHLHM